MKRIFFLLTLSLSVMSWIFFLCLSFFLLFPASSIKFINQYAISSYTIDFSDLRNSGNILNQDLKFSNIHIKHNDRSVLKVGELVLGISFKPQKILQPVSIRIINIKDGYYNQLDFFKSNPSFAGFIGFSDDSYFSFQNFEYKRDNSVILINGDLFGKFPGSLNGQLSFLHDNNLSTFAINLSKNSYRFSINLHSYEWLSLIPAYNASPFEDLVFKLNAVGEVQDNQSFIKGSFDYMDLYFQSLNIKSNQGSFVFQLDQDIGSLVLTEFLHPFVDEGDPIQINLSNKSVGLTKFVLSPKILELDKLKFTNFTVENLFLSFKNIIPKYSGLIRDLDIKNLYFDEILNLEGKFSGVGKNLKFILNSDDSVLKNHRQNFFPVSIIGVGNFYSSDLNLSGRLKNQSSGIDFNLKINSDPTEFSSIVLKGKDVTKDFITFSLPFSLSEYTSLINQRIVLGDQNSIYFNYLLPKNDLQRKFNAKILTNNSKLKINADSSIDLTSSIVELDEKDLYFFSPSGSALNFSYDAAFGLLNFQSQKLRLYSIHNMKSLELKNAMGLQFNSFNLPNVYAEHKGEINLSNLKLNNIISAKTKKFNLSIFDSHEINFDQASIFIVDLNKIFGLLPSTYLKQKPLILFSGTGLNSDYDLTLSTTINLDPKKYIPRSKFFQANGKDNFDLELTIQKNFLPILSIYSDLKNIELISPLNSLTKRKTKILPTEIFVTNLSNPSLKISNKVIDLHIRDLNKYEGYISIGKKLPENFIGFKKEPGLNLYLYLDSMNENFLDLVFSENTDLVDFQLNKLAFNIKNFQFYNNNYSNFGGIFDLVNSEVKGNLTADKLNLNLRMDKTGFTRIEMNDSIISNMSFINSTKPTSEFSINSRVIIRDSAFGKLKIKDFDSYILNNNKNFLANNLKLESNLISIKPLQNSSKAYFSINKLKPLTQVRGNFLIKDSNKIPYLGDFADFSYFNGSVNLQWKELSSLSNIEGDANFILKDLLIKNSITDSRAINLLGVLNLRNILGKLANLDLSIDEFTSTKLSRVEGDLLFNKSKMRLTAPLFIETNTAKMKWVGQINKNSQNNLHDLDLNLDLRVRIGENLPWYAAILGGLPAVAGSAVINEMFAEDINDLTNFQYEVLGTISEPKLERVK
tara:strand:- start:536 stop:3964 length:3429 start_codon:yes stop_codon:yes gene_type:complete